MLTKLSHVCYSEDPRVVLFIIAQMMTLIHFTESNQYCLMPPYGVIGLGSDYSLSRFSEAHLNHGGTTEEGNCSYLLPRAAAAGSDGTNRGQICKGPVDEITRFLVCRIDVTRSQLSANTEILLYLVRKIWHFKVFTGKEVTPLHEEGNRIANRTGFGVYVVLMLNVIRYSCHYFLDRILFHHDFHHDSCDYHLDFYGHFDLYFRLPLHK